MSRRSPSDVAIGKSSGLSGRLSMSKEVAAASACPGSPDNELASSWDTTNRVAHLGHLNRLPALTWAGKFKTTPHRLH